MRISRPYLWLYQKKLIKINEWSKRNQTHLSVCEYARRTWPKNKNSVNKIIDLT